MRPRGFTLVELLAATAAMALLMVGVLIVLAALTRDAHRQAAHDKKADPAIDRVLEQLRLDLVNAQSPPARTAPGCIEIKGNCGIDAKSFERDGRLAQVHYLLKESGGAKQLLREQIIELPGGKTERFSAIVMPGCMQFEIEPITRKDEQGSNPKEPPGYRVTWKASNGKNEKAILLMQ